MMDYNKITNKEIGNDYLHNLCDDCKKKIQAKMEKAQKKRFAKIAVTKLLFTLHKQICKKCKLKVYNQARKDKRIKQ